MPEKLRAMRGTHDILPEEARLWSAVEAAFSDVCRRYGYDEIRVPIFEATELFERGTGFATDVVQKEMYSFLDKKGRRLSLRPEATPSVMRAYLEHGLARQAPISKFFYGGPMFRYDRPGAGRYRQFHQIGVEVVGTASPLADAEVITLLWQYLKEIGLTKIGVRLNTLGCKACRVNYSGILKDFLKTKLALLCSDCNERYARNPLRVLDCKVAACKTTIWEAPEVATILCEECVRHFDEVKACLTDAGIAFSVEAKLVRGLDYYTRTVFEVFHEALGVDSSVGGGGRYDHLVEEIGGPATPAVGFSAGLERLVAAVRAEGSLKAADSAVDVFVASLGEGSLAPAFRLAAHLRERYKVWLEFDQRRIDRQVGTAAKLGAKYTIIIGEDEIAKSAVKIKDMGTGEQIEIPAGQVGTYLETRIGRSG